MELHEILGEEHKLRSFAFIHSSVALQPYVGSWPLLQFHNLFTQTVGLLGQVISPSQGRYLYAYTDIHASSGIRTHDPSVQAREGVHIYVHTN
jgi:hypothetical protein